MNYAPYNENILLHQTILLYSPCLNCTKSVTCVCKEGLPQYCKRIGTNIKSLFCGCKDVLSWVVSTDLLHKPDSVDLGTDLEVTFQDLLIQLKTSPSICSRWKASLYWGSCMAPSNCWIWGEVGEHMGRITHFSTIYFMQISLPNT